MREEIGPERFIREREDGQSRVLVQSQRRRRFLIMFFFFFLRGGEVEKGGLIGEEGILGINDMYERYLCLPRYSAC